MGPAMRMGREVPRTYHMHPLVVASTLGKLGEELPVVVASDYRKDAEGMYMRAHGLDAPSTR